MERVLIIFTIFNVILVQAAYTNYNCSAPPYKSKNYESCCERPPFKGSQSQTENSAPKRQERHYDIVQLSCPAEYLLKHGKIPIMKNGVINTTLAITAIKQVFSGNNVWMNVFKTSTETCGRLANDNRLMYKQYLKKRNLKINNSTVCDLCAAYFLKCQHGQVKANCPVFKNSSGCHNDQSYYKACSLKILD